MNVFPKFPETKCDESPTVIDLFSGAGGMTLGFLEAGFRPIAAVEHIKNFASTYAANFGPHVDVSPIEKAVERLNNVKADVVIGGPPCQGFSNLTGNKADDHRRVLWRYFMDVVESSGCGVFVMENVPNLIKSPEGQRIIGVAQEMGFFINAKVLLASRFGVPQNRRRTFIVGSRYGLLPLPETNGQRMTVRQALTGIPNKPTVTEFSRQNRPLRTDQLHIARNPTAISLARYKLIPPGGNRFDLQRLAPELTPACWIRKKTGGTDLYGRLDWDQPARCTIRTEFYKPEKGRYLHPEEQRPITHWEAARLQTFPDNFLWCGSKIQIAIQIGNAVPPKLAKVVADHVKKHVEARRDWKLRTANAYVPG